MKPGGELDNIELFEMARAAYLGTKRGFWTEFNNFKKHKDWEKVIHLLCPAITYQKRVHDWLRGNNSFCPSWKHFRTWINNRCWEDEFPEFESANAAQSPQKRSSSPANAKSPDNSANAAPEIKISTPEERRKIAEEYEWRIR